MIVEVRDEASGPGIEGAAVHIHQARVETGAPFEGFAHPDNKASLAMAEYFCACLNAFREVR